MLDPRNPDSSNSFSATSLLGLAHLRLCTGLASYRQLSSWDPDKIALNLYQSPFPRRTPRLAPALLHATQGLYIPVKLGLEWVSRNHFLHWDLSVFLYYLEAAVFLSKWLLSVADSLRGTPMSDTELNIMKTLQRIIEDIDESLDPLEEAEDHEGMLISHHDTADLARNLAVRIAATWARLFSHHNSPWPIVDLIGKSLANYARLMREQG